VRVDYWIIAHKFQQSRLELGSIPRTDRNGRQFWVVAAEREPAGRFIVRADEKLTAFLELQRAIHEFAVSLTL